MIASRKPVLPLDLQLGSTVDDGYGAVALHWEMVSNPVSFLPNTYQDLKNGFGLLSLEREINSPEVVARVSAEMLARELDAIPPTEHSTSARRRLTAAWQAVKALPMIAAAAEKSSRWAARTACAWASRRRQRPRPYHPRRRPPLPTGSGGSQNRVRILQCLQTPDAHCDASCAMDRARRLPSSQLVNSKPCRDSASQDITPWRMRGARVKSWQKTTLLCPISRS